MSSKKQLVHLGPAFITGRLRRKPRPNLPLDDASNAERVAAGFTEESVNSGLEEHIKAVNAGEKTYHAHMSATLGFDTKAFMGKCPKQAVEVIVSKGRQPRAGRSFHVCNPKALLAQLRNGKGTKVT